MSERIQIRLSKADGVIENMNNAATAAFRIVKINGIGLSLY